MHIAWLQVGRTTLLFISMHMPHSSSILSSISDITVFWSSSRLLYLSRHIAFCFLSSTSLIPSCNCIKEGNMTAAKNNWELMNKRVRIINVQRKYHSKGSQRYALKKKGRPSAGGSHMSGVWGREKLRQAFPLQNLRRGCFEPTTWWLSETALTTASGLPFKELLK